MQTESKAVIHLEDDGSGVIQVKVEGTGIALIALIFSVMEEDEEFRKVIQESVKMHQFIGNKALSSFINTKTYEA